MKDIKEYFVLNVKIVMVKSGSILVVLVIENGFMQNYYFRFFLLCYLFFTY